MSVKQEIEAAAVAMIKCPSCSAEPGRGCRNTVANDKGRHAPVKTHQRRLSTFVATNMKEKYEPPVES